MRVCVLVGSTQVAPGSTLSVSGANGPDGKPEPHRDRLGRLARVEHVDFRVTLRRPPAPGGSPNAACGRGDPGHQRESPGPARPDERLHLRRDDPPGPRVTTVLTVEVSCTSDATFSTAT